MRRGRFKVTFLLEGRQTMVEEGESLLEAARKAKIYVQSICGGEGTCGKCKVLVKSGRYRTKEMSFITEVGRKRGLVLACQTFPESDLEVEILLESKLEGVGKVEDAVLKSEPKVKLERLSPLTKKVFLRLSLPSLEDSLSDLDRLLRGLKAEGGEEPEVELSNIRSLPETMRKAGFKVTATLGSWRGKKRLIRLEPGDTSQRDFGIAVDVGTTTVVAQLLDLRTGQVLGTKSAYNSQARYGEDVISRMIYAERGWLDELQKAVVGDINALISALCKEAKVSPEEISSLSCAGNTTMMHLLFGVSPKFIKKEPYVPAFLLPPLVRAGELGISLCPHALVYGLPSVASYVGADIVAGVLSSGMNREERLSMLIDMGTNGETVLGNSEFLVCCSCSAGPSFEGGGIRCGMRAAKGAIQRVSILPDFEVEVSVIDQVRPRGICGAGMIDCLAEFLSSGLINRAGKFNQELTKETERLRPGEEGLEFVLIRAEESGIGKDIVLTQADIDNLIRSKAAVYAGAKVLLDKVGLSFERVEKFYVAGAFGNSLDIEKAVEIGLLPDLPQDRFEYIGNSSLSGARLCLLSQEALEEAQEIARRMTYIELSMDTSFYERFVGELFLPHTDTG